MATLSVVHAIRQRASRSFAIPAMAPLWELPPRVGSENLGDALSRHGERIKRGDRRPLWCARSYSGESPNLSVKDLMNWWRCWLPRLGSQLHGRAARSPGPQSLLILPPWNWNRGPHTSKRIIKQSSNPLTMIRAAGITMRQSPDSRSGQSYASSPIIGRSISLPTRSHLRWQWGTPLS